MRIENAFLDVPLPTRENKPRGKGLTMMIDWGLPLGHQNDILETSGYYIDLAKIAGTIPGLLPKEVLKKKIASYNEAEISTSQGGLFTEYAYIQGKLPEFFQEISKLGFSAVEVSDNLLDWSLEEKRRTIRMAIEDYGLKVLGEVGRKDEVMTDEEVIADLEVCIDSGVSAVFIEAYELFAGEEIRSELIKDIAKKFPPEKIIYELPVDVLPGISREFKHKVCSWMIAEFGSDVNLANVEWDEVLFTEMVRRKTGDNLETS
jgi:phosphosulfolactate synthase